MRVFITGGSGLIGRSVVKALHERGDMPVVLSRHRRKAERKLFGGEVVEGDPMVVGSWMGALNGCDAVINLAGESIFQPWTTKAKRAIRDSRVIGTANLVRAIEQANARPSVLVSGSAVGFYGNVPEEARIEGDLPGTDPLARVSVDWEQAARRAEELGLRVPLVRTGIVLSPDGGALGTMLWPFKLGLGGPVAGGEQWMSWIHIADMTRIILFALDTMEVSGPLNATAPEPVRNSEFTKTLAEILNRPSFMPVPKFALKMVFRDGAIALAGGQKVLPKKAQELGFRFEHPELKEALTNLLATG
jgi:uncharacterized protein (TIGR01777 family)